MRGELSYPHGLDENAIGALQNALLVEHLRLLAERSPWYRARFRELRLHPQDIRSVDDLSHLPFTRNSDLEAHNDAFLCVPRRQVIDHVTTSGTTGRPVPVLLDENDLQRLAANEHNALSLAGITPDDVVQLMTTMDRRFMAGLAYFQGARSLGAGVVRVGPGAPALQWESIERFGTTALITVPSFLIRLLEHARAHGIDPARTPVRKAICIGEPIRDADGQWNNLGRRIKESWNIELLGTYASTEMATACPERWEGSGHLVQPQLALVEVLDENDRPAPPGGTGEVVVTPFHVSAMPLLRYRTGDIVRWFHGPIQGDGQGRYLGSVLGRRDQRLKVKGTTLFPAQVLDAMATLPVIPNFVVICTTDEMGGDELEILVDLDEQHVAPLKEQLGSLLRTTPRITTMPSSAIDTLKWPRDSRKPHLFIDRRRHHHTDRT